ncbi:hypothetical protein MRS44_003803 [Fusarium solani]|uniref:uncharacterized protein n=1 Tax=Fusarium solani TaxID=169388 RepID=UPI0032C488D3|nr:hypothetical protein MRS44_003803 [Fusarium solani]
MGSADSGYEVVFAHEEFYAHVLTKFLMKTRRNGPFVLMHGDMAFQGNNLLWDDELNLVAVLDWEFCYTVPTSCFIPPAWINGFSPDPIRAIGRIGIFYDIEVKSLTRSIVERSQQQWPTSPLKEEWQRRAGESSDPHVSVVLALLHPEVIDSAFWDFFMHKFYSPYFLPPKSTKEIADQKLATFRKREDIKKFVRKRVADEKSYTEKYETGNFENLQQLPMLLHPLDVLVDYESTGPEIPPRSNFKPIPEPKLHPPLPPPSDESGESGEE